MDINLKNIKVVISEVDGIITNGFCSYDEMGTTLFKNYYINDFEAINNIKRYFKFIFLSKDSAINYSLCRRKNIPFFFAKTSKERTLVHEILPRYGVELSNVIYIGCSFSDERAMSLVDTSFCTIDSPASLKRVATGVLNSKGGTGVISSFYETIIESNLSSL